MHDWKDAPISPQLEDQLETDAILMDEPRRRWWIWLVYVLLFGASIPWYLPQGSAPEIWLGLPHWVVMSLMATLGIAIFTAIVVNRLWRDVNEEDKPV